jgi:hypothetical protein
MGTPLALRQAEAQFPKVAHLLIDRALTNLGKDDEAEKVM